MIAQRAAFWACAALAAVGSCERPAVAPKTKEPAVTFQVDGRDETPASAASAFETIRSSLGRDTPQILVRFASSEESFALRFFAPEDLVGCPGVIRITADRFAIDGEIVSSEKLAEFLELYGEAGFLTQSRALVYLQADEDIPATRLFDFSKIVSGITHPVDFVLPPSHPTE